MTSVAEVMPDIFLEIVSECSLSQPNLEVFNEADPVTQAEMMHEYRRENGGLDMDLLCILFGMGRQAVRNRLSLLSCPLDIQEKVKNRQMLMDVALKMTPVMSPARVFGNGNHMNVTTKELREAVDRFRDRVNEIMSMSEDDLRAHLSSFAFVRSCVTERELLSQALNLAIEISFPSHWR